MHHGAAEVCDEGREEQQRKCTVRSSQQRVERVIWPSCPRNSLGAHVHQCDLFAALQPALKARGVGIALTLEQANQPRQQSDKQGEGKQSLVDCAVIRGVEQEGWRFVAFIRLVPLLRFNLVNYAFGLTRVGLVEYVIASFVCMAPGAVAYTYLGYAGLEAASGRPGGLKSFAMECEPYDCSRQGREQNQTKDEIA